LFVFFGGVDALPKKKSSPPNRRSLNVPVPLFAYCLLTWAFSPVSKLSANKRLKSHIKLMTIWGC